MPNFITTNARIDDAGIINVVIGRNGAGKSRFLRTINNDIKNDGHYRAVYISPERGGTFIHDSNIEQANKNDQNWAFSARNTNQSEGFRKISAIYLKNLELNWLRKLESTPALRSDHSRKFDSEYLDRINDLLVNVRIIRDATNGSFAFENHEGISIAPHDLSSGESEAVTLTTEILYFFSLLDLTKQNVLLLDEPDVHLHPDLQARLGRFISNQIDALSAQEKGVTTVLIATHSTALIASATQSAHTKVAVKLFGHDHLTAKNLSEEIRKTAPFFAHPLSQVIAQEPVLIIEGEDDARVLQQAARSSQGKIKVFPCVAESVNHMLTLETFCRNILGAMYDHPVGYSLRDGDANAAALPDLGCIKRFRLQCYEIENLLLTDEALATMNSTWTDFQTRAQLWCNNLNAPTDGRVMLLETIINSGNRCRHIKIKDVRTLICAILSINKPWEVVVGQSIGALPNPLPATAGATSLIEFFGRSALEAIGFTTT